MTDMTEQQIANVFSTPTATAHVRLLYRSVWYAAYNVVIMGGYYTVLVTDMGIVTIGF